MATIDTLYNKVLEDKKHVFNFNDYFWHNFAINRIKDLNFVGQIDKNMLYISQLHQVIRDEAPFDESIKTLNLEYAEEFYLTGEIHDLWEYHPFAWAFWAINLENKYIKVFTSYYNDMRKSPKDNYAIAYEQSQKKIYKQYAPNSECSFFAYRHPRRNVFKRLIEIVEYSKTHRIEFANFDKKVYHDISKYFGLINNKNFIDDQYVETARPELINVSRQNFSQVKIYNDMDVRSKLQGSGYREIKFDTNGVIRTFVTLKDMNDYLYSLIKYINENNAEFNIKQKITSMEKHYLSNKWPTPETEEEANLNRKELAKYQVSVQKFNDKVIVQADVQEYGIVYVMTNYWENKYVEYRSY